MMDDRIQKQTEARLSKTIYRHWERSTESNPNTPILKKYTAHWAYAQRDNAPLAGKALNTIRNKHPLLGICKIKDGHTYWQSKKS